MSVITTFYSRIIARELQREGFDTAQLYAGTSLMNADIFERSQIPMEDFLKILTSAVALTGNHAIGLMIGTQTRLAGLGEMGVAALAAPTVLDGLRVIETYSRLQTAYAELILQAEAEYLNLTVRFHGLHELEQIHHEVSVLAIQNFLEVIIGQPFTSGHYYFSHPPPDYSNDYEQVMHSAFEFNSEHTGVKVPNEYLPQRSPYYDAVLWNQSLQHCATMLETLRSTESKTYSLHISTLLRSQPPPLPTLQEVASRLYLSERSLSRRLREEDSSYRQLCNNELKFWACHYLADSNLTVEAIALMLGYQDSANFRRAFKSWLKCSPAAFREQNEQAAPV